MEIVCFLWGGDIVTDTRLNVLAPLWHCSSTCKLVRDHYVIIENYKNPYIRTKTRY